MDRNEFCNLLIKAREESNTSLYAIQKKLNITFQQAKRIETGENNFSIDRMFEYLNSINYHIVVYSIEFNNRFILRSREDFSSCFINIRGMCSLSQNDAAIRIGVNRTIITGIESRDTNTSIDKFIQCIYGLDFKLEIKKYGTN